MLVEVFGKCPQIKVMNFLLSNPFDDYTKQQIAVGSGVSRATLDKFINIFIENNILLFKNSKYALNRNSSIVNKFDAIQEELVQNEIFKQQFHKNQFVKFNDDELNLLIDDDDESDIDLDAEEKKIEFEEEILVKKYNFKFYSNLNDESYYLGGLINGK